MCPFPSLEFHQLEFAPIHSEGDLVDTVANSRHLKRENVTRHIRSLRDFARVHVEVEALICVDALSEASNKHNARVVDLAGTQPLTWGQQGPLLSRTILHFYVLPLGRPVVCDAESLDSVDVLFARVFDAAKYVDKLVIKSA